MSGRADAFWSYAHDDDAADDGAIVALAARLQAEFSLLTGNTLEVFVDRSGIAWGDAWKERIDNALVETTFFIPVLSPRYFTREECRRELSEFHAQAASLGVTELILPILYAGIPDFAETNADELIALSSKLQYADWTKLRLLEPSSAEYRQATNALAQRLVTSSDQVADRQVARERRSGNPEDDDFGLQDALTAIDRLLPDWRSAVENDEVVFRQHHVTNATYKSRLQRLGSRQGGARFAILSRLAADLLPLAERHLANAEAYASRTIELAPFVEVALRVSREHPDVAGSLEQLKDAVDAAVMMIDQGAAQPGETTVEFAHRYAHISRAMAQLEKLHIRANRLVWTANDTVEGWHTALREVTDSASD